MQNFVITIARGYGSGGRTIGKMLSEELGINFYDRELLRLASDDSGINENLFAQADEKIKNSLLYKVAHKVYKGELIPPDKDDFVSNDNLFNYQAKVIKELANQESCIIVGRCADYILKDYKNVVRLYIYASTEHCIDTLSTMSSLTHKELEKKILTTDKRHAEYYEHYTGQKWSDVSNYDLCINTGVLTFENAAGLVKEYLKIVLK